MTSSAVVRSDCAVQCSQVLRSAIASWPFSNQYAVSVMVRPALADSLLVSTRA